MFLIHIYICTHSVYVYVYVYTYVYVYVVYVYVATLPITSIKHLKNYTSGKQCISFVYTACFLSIFVNWILHSFCFIPS